MKNKEGQAWGFDLMVASILFIMGMASLYVYTINYPLGEAEPVHSMLYDATNIASIIFSEGYPSNWDQTNVVRIGILTDNKVDEVKLANFYNLANTNYKSTQGLFRTKYNYYLYFSEPMNISGNLVEGIGNKSSSPNDLFQITRFVAYRNKTITANVYLWE